MNWKELEKRVTDLIAKIFRNQLQESLKQTQMEVALQNDEVWLESKAFLAQFQMFSKDWLEHYGWKLPRERVEVIGDDGQKRVTRWAYPRNEIQRMIRERELVNL